MWERRSQRSNQIKARSSTASAVQCTNLGVGNVAVCGTPTRKNMHKRSDHKKVHGSVLLYHSNTHQLFAFLWLTALLAAISLLLARTAKGKVAGSFLVELKN